MTEDEKKPPIAPFTDLELQAVEALGVWWAVRCKMLGRAVPADPWRALIDFAGVMRMGDHAATMDEAQREADGAAKN